jgi:hypothetical protein
MYYIINVIGNWPSVGRETRYLQVICTYNLQSYIHVTGSNSDGSGVSPGLGLLGRDRKVYLHIKLVAQAAKQ